LGEDPLPVTEEGFIDELAGTLAASLARRPRSEREADET
jgi:hypothetical protein